MPNEAPPLSAAASKDLAIKMAIVALASNYPEHAEEVFGLERLSQLAAETKGPDADVFQVLKSALD